MIFRCIQEFSVYRGTRTLSYKINDRFKQDEDFNLVDYKGNIVYTLNDIHKNWHVWLNKRFECIEEYNDN